MGGRKSWRSCLAPGLLLEEVDDKVLVLADEVVGEALSGEVIAKVLPPQWIESFQRRELGRGRLVAILTVGAAGSGVATGGSW